MFVIHLNPECIQQIPGFEMPTGSSEKKFVFETTGEILNAIKHDQLELIHSALDEREPSTRAVKV